LKHVKPGERRMLTMANGTSCRQAFDIPNFSKVYLT
jgi:hypothetical protein